MAPLTLLWLLSTVTASTAHDSLALAQWLYTQGDTYRAITEYKRAAFVSASVVTEATSGLARCYLDLGQHRLARYHARRALELAPTLAGEMRLIEWQALVYDGLRSEANELRNFLAGPHASSETTAKLYLIEGARDLQRGLLAQGRDALLASAQAATGTAPARLAAAILQRLQPPNSSAKSSLAAGLLSALIPGAGQIYAGQPWEGIGLTALIAGLTAGTVHSYRNHGRFEFWLLPTVSFYFGGISRSVQLIKEQENAQQRQVGQSAVAVFRSELRALGLALH